MKLLDDERNFRIWESYIFNNQLEGICEKFDPTNLVQSSPNSATPLTLSGFCNTAVYNFWCLQ